MPQNASARAADPGAAASALGQEIVADTSTPAQIFNPEGERLPDHRPRPDVGLRQDPRLTERLHRLGPRPVDEALLKVARGRDVLEVLEELARVEPLVRRWPQAREWPTSIWCVA
jgi:hypothetical protein